MKGSESKANRTYRELIVSKLGYWPEFCDAKIVDLVFHPYTDSGTTLAIVLHYIDMDLNRDLKVKLNFRGISDMELNGLGIENIIDRLDVTGESGDYVLEIEACAGLFGSCKCKEVDVEIISLSVYSDSS